PDNRHAAAHALALLHTDSHIRRQQDVSARTEFDHAEAFSKAEIISLPFPADHSPRQYSRNLLANDRDLLALNGQCILLIHEARLLIRSHQKLARRVKHVDDSTWNGRTIDVHVQRRQK